MTETNPYDALGVPRDADDATIKRAYRQKAAESHPDKGGDPAAFALVASAYDILKDQERRAKFDATGDGSKKSEMAQILEVISEALDFVVLAADEQNIEIVFVQMIPTLKSRLMGMRDELDDKLRPALRSIEQHRKLISRFSIDGEPNAIDEMIRHKIGQIEVSIAPLLLRRELIGKAGAMLTSYSFRADQMSNFWGGAGFSYQPTAGAPYP